MAPTRPEPTGVRRLLAAWKGLAREQRTVAIAAAVLLLTMLLPWYSLEAFASVRGALEKTSSAKPAITVFSFVEAAIFLVALGVTLLVLARGDRRAFHLPGGDGLVVTLAGAWATFLIFYRFVDKPGEDRPGAVRLEYGLSWGIFFGLLAALALLAAGLRLRAAQIAEPALPGDVAPDGGPVAVGPARGRERAAAAPRPGSGSGSGSGSEELTRAQRRQEREARRRADAGTPVRESRPSRAPAPEDPTRQAAPGDAPTRHVPPSEEPTRHVAPGEAPTLFDPPPEPRRGDGSSFEPPEFELPPHRPRGE